MKPKKQFRSQELRSILVLLLLVVLVGGIAIFQMGLNIVRDYSAEVSQRLVDADASEQQVSELMLLKDELANSGSLVSKASQIFASADNYQSQAILDIQRYATAANISLSKTEFEPNPENPSTAIAVVTLNSPVSYVNLIGFLNNIESNLPKMQINSLSLGRVDDASGDNVNIEEIRISISMR